MEYASKIIDHLGIVAGICREIGLAGEIDRLGGGDRRPKVTTGEAVVAMVINALGFVSKPLYLFPEFMRNKPVELLIRDGLKPEDFNDDTLGRALDRLYDNNPTIIFMRIALRAAEMLGVERRFLHLDTTTMSVHGEYESDDVVPIEITRGYSKYGRRDLKQFLVSLIVSSEAELPVWVAALSGNTSDNRHFRQVIKEFSRSLSEGDDVYYVMDSAGYSSRNVGEISPLVKWVCRVPESISGAERLIEETDVGEMEEMGGNLRGYRCKGHITYYGGVEQKWIVVFSGEGYRREMEMLESKINEEGKRISKELWHFKNREFHSREDGISALERISAKWRYHSLGSFKIIETNRTGKVGRPSRGSAVEKLYRIEAEAVVDGKKVERERMKKGKFILATNDIEMNSYDILDGYKRQQGVERGFRFLKDPLFFTSSVFLKSPERIVSLVMIMALSLLIYAFGQYKLRKALEERGEDVPDQRGKPTRKPTMRWIFQQFEGIHLLEERGGDGKVMRVLNLREINRKIISLMGRDYEKIYLL